MKPLNSVKLLIIHCVANRCNKPFSVESLIRCGKEKYGQCSYHYYVRYNGDIIPLLPETLQGIHARHYNHCSIGIVYEGGLDAQGNAADTRTEAQKLSLRELLKQLRHDYPDAKIVGHCELPEQRMPIDVLLDWLSRDESQRSQLPRVKKACPCYLPSKEYADL
jgi:N-acetyl-anhydromuramyl-L-alanine amidase AmpD